MPYFNYPVSLMYSCFRVRAQCFQLAFRGTIFSLFVNLCHVRISSTVDPARRSGSTNVCAM